MEIDLGLSKGSLCSVLKYAFGAGVMNESPLAHNPLIHWHFTPGAHAILDIRFRELRLIFVFLRGVHGCHSG